MCLNEPVSYRRGLMLLVGLTKPERLQGRGQTKRSTWSYFQLGRGLGVGLITPALQNHSLFLKIELHLPHLREALKSHHWNHQSSNHQRQLRTSGKKSSGNAAGHRIPDGWQGLRNKDGQVSKAGQTGKVSHRHFTSLFLNIYVFGAILACPLIYARVRVFSLT